MRIVFTFSILLLFSMPAFSADVGAPENGEQPVEPSEPPPEPKLPVVPVGFSVISDPHAEVIGDDGRAYPKYPPGAYSVSADGETFATEDGTEFTVEEPDLDEVDETGNSVSDSYIVDPQNSPSMGRSDVVDLIREDRFVLPFAYVQRGLGGSVLAFPTAERFTFPNGEELGASAPSGQEGPGKYMSHYHFGQPAYAGIVVPEASQRDGEQGSTAWRSVAIEGRAFQTGATVSGKVYGSGDHERAAYSFQPIGVDSTAADRLSRIVDPGDPSIVWQYSKRTRDRLGGAGTFLADDFLSTDSWPLFYQAIPFGQSAQTEVSRSETADSNVAGRLSYRAQSSLRLFPLDVFGFVDLQGRMVAELPSKKHPQFVPVGGSTDTSGVFDREISTTEPIVLVPKTAALFSEARTGVGPLATSGLSAKAPYIIGDAGVALPGSRALSELGSGKSPATSIDVAGYGRVTALDLGLIGSAIGSPADVVISYQGNQPLVLHSGATFALAPNGTTYIFVQQRLAIVSTRAPVLIRGSISYIQGMQKLDAVSAANRRFGVRIVSKDVMVVPATWGGFW